MERAPGATRPRPRRLDNERSLAGRRGGDASDALVSWDRPASRDGAARGCQDGVVMRLPASDRHRRQRGSKRVAVLRRPLPLTALIAALAAAPVAIGFLFVARYGVNGVYQDDWVKAAAIVQETDGRFPLSNLFGQQNEHRFFFPGLLML